MVSTEQQQQQQQQQQPSDTRWPFPTQDNPLKPWTPKEVKAYAKLQREKAEEAPF